jgi:hypothetical protein
MTIWFVYKTDEKWKKIYESIKLYLQYCHDIGESNIQVCKYDSKNGNSHCDGIKPEDIIAVPLFEKKESGEITPHGLEVIKDLRKNKGYGFNTLFLVLSEQDIPDYFHPEKDMHYYAEGLLGNPKFGHVQKAVFLGEIIYEEKDAHNEKASSEDREYTNIINLQKHDALTRFAKLIKGKIKLPSIDEDLREKYYDVFVKYYELLMNGGEIPKKTEELLTTAQKIYNELNDIQPSPHSDKYELFKAPIPFPLLELVNAKEEINNNLTKDGKVEPIKLLLIDNRIDKIKSSDSKQTLIDVIDNFDLKFMFMIEMLGNITDKNGMLQFEDLAEGNDNEKVELFHYKEFRNDLKKIFRNKVDGDHNYAIKVYDKITDCNFVLLDFFLNKENTYLAFDFIKDIAKIKNEKQDSSTTWYFITSAVYGSVVNYSQSGLLAEYYESSVVNAGDDPINKRRHIIFVYKLLTFIQARIRSFKGFHDSVIDSKFLNCITKECKNTQCLIENQNLFRKYLAEFGEIIKVFPGKETEEEQFRETVELLDSTINQFLWLPEADWPMIQQQIEHINSRLEDIDDFKNWRFPCNYIREEIRKRSDIY